MADALTKAGRYEVVRELGRGSMGVVYEGFDPVIERRVAIKTMLTEGLTLEEFGEYKARFQREARAAGVLNHPNIVSVFDYGEDSGILYLIMEYLEGKSLEKLVAGQNILPIETIIPLYGQVCSALDHAHQNGIVHRDIKPANIMVLANGLVKVTDFGIAKMVSMGMTQTGRVLGTPNYMSPEQVKGRQVDGRSDIFSLGIILYDLVTGEMPFAGQNITTVIYKIINEDPIPPRELDASIHPGLSYVICKALAKSPDERYQTCRELADDLKNFKHLGGRVPPSATMILKAPRVQNSDIERGAATPVESPTPPVAPAEPARIAPVQQPSPGQAPVQVIAPAPAYQEPRTSPMAWILMTLLGVVTLGLFGVAGYMYLHKGKPQVTSPPVAQSPAESNIPASQPQAGTTESGKTINAGAGLPAQAPGEQVQPPAKTVAEKPAAGKGMPSTKEGGTPSANALRAPSGKGPGAAAAPSASPGGAATSAVPSAGGGASATAAVPSASGGGPASAPAMGQLLVTANVAGAKISVDGSSETNWVTPHSSTINRPAGAHQVVVSKEGYGDYEQFVTLEGGKTTTVNAQLSVASGEVVVNTTPPGLEVLIDGKLIGPSPVRVTVAAGSHKYTVRREGWEPFEGTFTVSSGARAIVRVNMGG